MAPPRPRRRWIALALLVLLLAAAIGWIQTEAAFQRLWLPVASRLAGGSVQADTGRLGLGGTLEARQVAFDLPGQAAGTVEELRLHVRPLDSLLRGRATIETFELIGALVTLPDPPEDEPAPAPPSAAEGHPPKTEPLDLAAWPEIRHARITHLELRTGSPEAALTLGPIQAAVDDLRIPERGSVTLQVPMAQPAAELSAALDLTVELGGGEDAPDTAPAGSPLRAELALHVDGRPSHGRGELALALDADGRLSEDPRTLDLAALHGSLVERGERLLELEATGRLLPEPELDAKVRLGAATRAAELLGLGSLAARVEADLRVEGRYDALVALPKVSVDELRVPADAEPSLAEPLLVQGRLEWSAAPGTLFFAPLTLGAAADGPLGQLRLEGEVRPGKAAQLAIAATRFDLLPWLRLARGAGGVPDRRAPIGGTLTIEQTGSEVSVEGDLSLSVGTVGTVGGADGAAPLRLRPVVKRTASSDQERLTGHLALEGPPVEGQPGRARIEWEREAGGGRAKTVVRGDLTALDLTPLAPLWEGEAPPPAPEAEASSGAEPPAASPAERFDLDLRIGALQLRGLAVRGGRLRAQLGGGSWEARVDGLGLADGSVDAEAYGGPRGGGERIGWDLRVESLDLEPLLGSLSPDGEAPFSGRFSLASQAEGIAAPGEPLTTAPDGRVSFALTEGRASGLDMQRVLTEVADLAEFAVIDYDEVQGDYAIEDGRVLVDELHLGGAALHLVATGEISAEQVDLVVNPRVGPNLAAMVPGGLLDGVLSGADQVLALPLVVVIEGPPSAIEVGVEPAAPSILQSRFSGLAELVTPEGTAAPSPETPAPPPPGS